MGISVRELISDSDRQAEGMKLIADRVDAAAAVSLMDLSVEAECFGASIAVSQDEVPTVKGCVVSAPEEAEALAVPPVGAGRTDVYIRAIGKAVRQISDRPVFAGMIGPYSLAGRLADVTEIMYYCYDEPEMVAVLLEKVTEFLIAYGKAYKEAGADGIMLAEPLAGLLSPELAEEFSAPYVKRIVEALQEDSFAIVYHNCGNCTIQMIDSILDTGAAACHFGNAIDMTRMLPLIPEDILVMGNIDPAGQFRNGTPESIREATLELMRACGGYRNFLISSGCDIPPMSKWENIDAFFVWGFMDSQETVSISPEMFEEFIFPCYKKISESFGLLSYGCCEPVDPIWENCISRLENLRKVSISPWCNEAYMGERLRGSKIIYHRKPSPNYLGTGTLLDEEAFRTHIRESLQAARGCEMEITQRDVYTINKDISKAKRYVDIIKEEIVNC